MKGHEEYKEIVALAALNTADEAERRALDEHLAGCAECRAELRESRDAAAALAFAAVPISPSPELRARVLASLKTTPQQGGAHSNKHETAAPPTANVVSIDERRRRDSRTPFFSRPAYAFGAVAASLILCALAAATAVLWQRNNEMKSQVASMSDALERTRNELGQTRGELSRTLSERELLAAPDAHTATLAGTKAAEGARARLTFDERTGEALLTAADLPPAPAGKAYQLWFIAGSKPLPGSVFSTDARGRAELHERIPAEGRGGAVVYAVTLEPAGGAPAPTGAIYLKSAS